MKYKHRRENLAARQAAYSRITDPKEKNGHTKPGSLKK